MHRFFSYIVFGIVFNSQNARLMHFNSQVFALTYEERSLPLARGLCA